MRPCAFRSQSEPVVFSCLTLWALCLSRPFLSSFPFQTFLCLVCLCCLGLWTSTKPPSRHSDLLSISLGLSNVRFRCLWGFWSLTGHWCRRAQRETFLSFGQRTPAWISHGSSEGTELVAGRCEVLRWFWYVRHCCTLFGPSFQSRPKWVSDQQERCQSRALCAKALLM